MKKIVFSTITALLLLLAGCLSTKSAAHKNGQTPSPEAAFTEKTLSNGIPLVIKKQSGNFIALRFVVEGGAALLDESSAGLESVTLDLMLAESGNVSPQETAELEKTRDFFVSAACKADYSYAELKCAENDFADAFALFADRILHPTLGESAFSALMQARMAALDAHKTNPSFMLSALLREAAYKNHPYATSPSITETSANTITLPAVRQHHETMLRPERIALIAAGNFGDGAVSADELFGALDSTFGTLRPERNRAEAESATPLDIPPCDFSDHERMTVVESPLLTEEWHAVAYFDAPNRFDADYVPYVLAGMIVDDILFDEMKQKDCSVQSLGVGVMGGKELSGVISVLKAETQENPADLIDGVVSSFPKEAVVRRELDRYKKEYIMALHERGSDISNVADNVMQAYLYAKNPAQYLARPDLVESATAKQVIAAHKKYFGEKNNARKWIVLTGATTTQGEAAESE